MLRHGVEAGRCSAALALVWLRALPNTALSWPRPVQNSPSNTPPAPQPVQNSPSNTPPAPQPVQNSPNNTPPAPQPVQNSPGTHKIGNIWPFWTCRANFLSLLELAQPAGRTFSRSCSNSPQQGELSLASDTTRHNTPILPAPTGTKLTQQHPTSAPTGTKLARQHPTSNPTGTKLTQQHPTSTPTGTKLARHTQNQQNSPILDMQGELSLANPPPG